jgi:hypothetical protein
MDNKERDYRYYLWMIYIGMVMIGISILIKLNQILTVLEAIHK